MNVRTKHQQQTRNVSDFDLINNIESPSVCYVTTEEELQATTAREKIAIVPLQTELNTYNMVGHIEGGTDLNIQSATRCNQTTNKCMKVGNIPHMRP